MLILSLSIALWVIAGVSLWRVVAIGHGAAAERRGRGESRLWLAAVSLAVLPLLMSPHEDVLGGQDGGAYLNMASRLAREQSLTWTDPMLAAVPTNDRESFLYFDHRRPYLSKYATGRVVDLTNATMGVWFFPAYPIAASLPARADPAAALYVVPLFALFAALALRALASMLLPHRGAGEAAFLFFLLNPLVTWHARHPRPEVIAAFFLFAGAALLIHAVRGVRGARQFDILLASICIGLAPFFHVTAAMLAVPAALIVLGLVLGGRDDFLIFAAVTPMLFVLFVAQTLSVTDTYHVKRYLDPLLALPAWLRLLSAFVLIGLYALSVGVRRWKARRGPSRGVMARPGRKLEAWLFAIAVPAVFAVCYWLSLRDPGGPDTLTFPYVHRTDWVALVRMLSWPVVILAVAGLSAWGARNDERQCERRSILVFAGPAALMVGHFDDFFMTRYTLVAFAPLMALGLASLWAFLPDDGRRGRVLSGLGLAAVVALLLYNRLPLLTVTENQGLVNALRRTAARARAENAFLLADYPRLAAPLDDFLGVPSLSIHPERDPDARTAEAAWARLAASMTNRTFLFLTPFQPPMGARFRFQLLETVDYSGRKLRTKGTEIPDGSNPVRWIWSLYRAIPRDGAAAGAGGRTTESLPCLRTPGVGTLGWSGFEKPKDQTLQVDMRSLKAGESLGLPTGLPAGGVVSNAALWFVGTGSTAMAFRVEGWTGRPAVQRVDDTWWLAHAIVPAMPSTSAVTVAAEAGELGLQQGWLVVEGRAMPMAVHGNGTLDTRPVSQRHTMRVASSGAVFAAPAPAVDAAMLLLAHGPDGEKERDVDLSLVTTDGRERVGQSFRPAGWNWMLLPLRGCGAEAGVAEWRIELVRDGTKLAPGAAMALAAVYVTGEPAAMTNRIVGREGAGSPSGPADVKKQEH